VDSERIAELERKTGQLAMEIDFLKQSYRLRGTPLSLTDNGAAACLPPNPGSAEARAGREPAMCDCWCQGYSSSWASCTMPPG
jgi:hypothetical protein